MDGLSEREAQLLAFERTWWRQPGSKERNIRLRFGITPARYHQALDRLIDRPEALLSDPMTVRRLRRLRDARRGRRAVPAKEHARWA